MHGDVIGLVAFDLILRGVPGCVMRIPFVPGIFRMDFCDLSGYLAGFGIPADMISHFEPSGHNAFLAVLASESRLRPAAFRESRSW
jgi:hypothetical protein